MTHFCLVSLNGFLWHLPKKFKPCPATLRIFLFFEFLKLFQVLVSPIWNCLLLFAGYRSQVKCQYLGNFISKLDFRVVLQTLLLVTYELMIT